MVTDADRLSAFYAFDRSVLDIVSHVAERQRSYSSYEKFIASVGQVTYHTVECEGRPTIIMDICPPDCDRSRVLSVQLPIASGFDPYNTFHVATIAAVNPGWRVVASGNPSRFRNDSGRLNHTQRRAVARGDLRPLVAPELQYLRDVKELCVEGYSYGGLQATIFAGLASQPIKLLIAIDPPSVRRTLSSLAMAFALSGQAVDDYIAASEIPIFLDARHDSRRLEAYIALLWPTNRIIGRTVATGSFHTLIAEALNAHPEMEHAMIVWGSRSRLATDHATMSTLVRKLKDKYGSDRITGLRINGDHAFPNYVLLHAALVCQGMLGA